jgi:hypothetical protein
MQVIEPRTATDKLVSRETNRWQVNTFAGNNGALAMNDNPGNEEGLAVLLRVPMPFSVLQVDSIVPAKRMFCPSLAMALRKDVG